MCLCVNIYIYILHKFFFMSLSYEFKKENCFSRRSEYDRQAVYALCAGTGVTQGSSPLYRVKAGPRDP